MLGNIQLAVSFPARLAPNIKREDSHLREPTAQNITILLARSPE